MSSNFSKCYMCSGPFFQPSWVPAADPASNAIDSLKDKDVEVKLVPGN